jgi:error-prone DNA polymerase
MTPSYVELHAHSCYSLLDGVPTPAELVDRAVAYDMPALALTDHDGLYGLPPFVQAAEAAGLKPLAGAEVTLQDGSHLTLLAETAEGYGNLCEILTLAHLDQPKGQARLPFVELADLTPGLIALSGCKRGRIPQLLVAGELEEAAATARGLARGFGPGHFYLELQRHFHPGEARLLRRLLDLGEALDLPVVATGNVHYLDPEGQAVQDALTALRHHTTLEDAGTHLYPNDEVAFHPPGRMAARFRHNPEALAATVEIAERCASAATFLPRRYQPLPDFPIPNGGDAPAFLRRLCERALEERYPVAPPRALLVFLIN